MGKTVAVIPARGGSKGIPGKNTKNFAGKPLLEWSIIQALQTKTISEVYVSSDSEEILKVAENAGAGTIRRPADISDDFASSESAILHALETIKDDLDYVIMVQATSPLRKPLDFADAISEMKLKSYDSMFSGAVLDDFLIWEKTKDETFSSFNYDYKNRGRRQERIPQYVENGSFYISRPSIYLDHNNRLGGNIGTYLMEDWQSFEIDKPEDLELLELIFKQKLLNQYLNEDLAK